MTQYIQVTTRDGAIFHCQATDMMPVGNVHEIAGIGTRDDLTDEQYAKLRASEQEGRAAFFGGEQS